MGGTQPKEEERMHPIYVMREPAEVADDFEERLLALGVSEEYAADARDDLLKRAVQVRSSDEANAIICGRIA
jgi:hypothetical protein